MEIISRYSGLKARSYEMAAYLRQRLAETPTPNLRRLHADLTGCANYLVFHNYFTVEQVRLVKASTCKRHLLCPFCAARRAARMVQLNLEKFDHLLVESPQLIPVMITLTIKNGESLAERFSHLNSSFRRLLQKRRDAKKGRSSSEFSKIVGAVYSFETTNKNNGWHPHIHMVAFLNDYIDVEQLSCEWLEITGDSFIVDVRLIKPSEGKTDLIAASLEVFKYALKFQDMTLEKNFEAFNQLRSRRLIGSFGKLFSLVLPDELLDDPLQNLPYIEMFYKYYSRSKKYCLVDATPIIDPAGLPERPVSLRNDCSA